ncbi:MAG: ABC transporter ATP-binding protein [Clostridiales bacterium]|nr:ABC transporter ATP-binding protein [Candidatus Crickella caballi]
MNELIRLENITKSFDENVVLNGIDLTVGENEFVTLLGPSGCGKTTTLRIIGGFEQPDSGIVYFDGQDITTLPANQRNINTVFQNYALFPHMNVGENIAFGLRVSGKSDAYIKDKIKYALKLVNLKGYENRRIDQLSGGQQQRIAMARAIVNEPKVLLLDEPLGALDLKLRQEMQYELVRLKKELGITFIYVTHDQEEALTMSDKVVVMNEGYIQQEGTPEEIYDEPINAFVADFIGDSNILSGKMVDERVVEINGIQFPCIDGTEQGFPPKKRVDVVIRPEDIEIRPYGKGLFNGTIISKLFIGVHYEMLVQSEDGKIEWLLQNYDQHDVGAKIGMYVRPENIQIMHKPKSEAESAMEIDL